MGNRALYFVIQNGIVKQSSDKWGSLSNCRTLCGGDEGVKNDFELGEKNSSWYAGNCFIESGYLVDYDSKTILLYPCEDEGIEEIEKTEKFAETFFCIQEIWHGWDVRIVEAGCELDEYVYMFSRRDGERKVGGRKEKKQRKKSKKSVLDTKNKFRPGYKLLEIGNNNIAFKSYFAKKFQIKTKTGEIKLRVKEEFGLYFDVLIIRDCNLDLFEKKLMLSYFAFFKKIVKRGSSDCDENEFEKPKSFIFNDFRVNSVFGNKIVLKKDYYYLIVANFDRTYNDGEELNIKYSICAY